MPSRSGMSKITVDKETLEAVLVRNRDEHRGLYDRAVERFRAQAIERLDGLVAVLRKGKLPNSLYIGLPLPEEHTKDYDRAMAMLALHLGETIELTEDGYEQLVNNEWGWTNSFTSNTTSYLEGEADDE